VIGSEENQFGIYVAPKRYSCVARSQYVFEVMSLCRYACLQPCSPPVSGFVDDALRNTVPSVNASARQRHISVFV